MYWSTKVDKFEMFYNVLCNYPNKKPGWLCNANFALLFAEDKITLLCLLALRAPTGLVALNTTRDLKVCWTSSPDDPPDGYYVTSHPPIYPNQTSLWINQSSPGENWTRESVCVNLGTFTPGQTYEVSVVCLKGEDRSSSTTIIHTTGKRNNNLRSMMRLSEVKIQLF